MRIALIVIMLAVLSACASAPRQTRNVCAVFDQRDGWFDNWQRSAESAERTYGVPVPILMATMYVESGFRHNARPPRTKLLGFIPWKRQSSAFGYSQALDGTWTQYQKETGNWAARRTSFADAVDFIGWYHRDSGRRNGIALNDAYSLYLAYYSGPKGYANGSWRSNGKLQQTARKFAGMAASYQGQLRGCR
ncbi:transglycosylase SLT domain-containing protein [Pararhizobium sp.]|uniref:transglycosylase SLT domain-containing protein n=1 Tax=Pararhizobium sp. TaxID=1977563 RepID=UPI0027167AFB|nr:hypothetical protein [Pararhizobium sp.]MDO9416299.1 hypothetical protein [Pararhizobium sp.]